MADNELIQVPRPILGRPNDPRLDQDYINSRPELAGVEPFNPEIDVDLVGEINDKLGRVHALVAYADPELAERMQQATAGAEAATTLAATTLGRTTIPTLADLPDTAGVYNVLGGAEAGQTWERLADGSQVRRPELEAAARTELEATQLEVAGASLRVNRLRSNLEATTEQLRAGTFDAGNLSRIYTELGSLSVTAGSGAPDVDNVRVFALAGGQKAILDQVPRSGAYFGLRAGNTEERNTAALTDFAEFAAAQTATNIADLLYAGARLELAPGEYRYGDLPVITGNLSITSEHHRAAVLRYMGTGHSLIINSDSVGPYAGAPQHTNSVTIERVVMMSEQGSGILLGSVIQPNVLLNEIEFRKHKLGYVVELGEAVYFVTVRNCRSTEHHRFLHQRNYCDRLLIEGCSFGASVGAHLMLEGPTAIVRDNNFESTGQLDGAAIVLTANHAQGTNILSNRFGPEGNPYLTGEAQKPAPYDIVVNAGSSTVYSGLNIQNNHHFSRATEGMTDEGNGVTHYYGRKTAPVALNTAVADANISSNSHVNYTTGLYVISGNPAAVRDSTPNQGLRVDRLEDVSPQIRGSAWERTISMRRRERVVVGSEWFSAGSRFAFLDSGANNLPIAQPTAGGAGYPHALKQLGGYVAEHGATAGAAAWMDIPGSVVQMPINGAAVPVSSPVYVSDGGEPTLTPNYLTRRVGWTQQGVYNCRVLLDFADHLAAPGMPTSGAFVAGDVVDALTPTVQGRAGSRYVLLGWRRLTTGSGHVFGTDWVERREPTGG